MAPRQAGSMAQQSAYLKVGDVVTLFCDQLNGWVTSGDLVVGYGLWVPKLKVNKSKILVPRTKFCQHLCT